MKKILSFFTISCVLVINVFAFTQYPNILYYQGKEYTLHSNPLDPYFELYPEKSLKELMSANAALKGYIASFEIVDTQMFLKDIEIEIERPDSLRMYDNRWESVINIVFPEQNNIKTAWFSGILVLSNEKSSNNVESDSGTVFNKYIIIEVENGNFTIEKRFNRAEYDKFKKEQFLLFKKTEEYQKIIADLNRTGRYTQKILDAFIENYVTDYISKILVDLNE